MRLRFLPVAVAERSGWTDLHAFGLPITKITVQSYARFTVQSDGRELAGLDASGTSDAFLLIHDSGSGLRSDIHGIWDGAHEHALRPLALSANIQAELAADEVLGDMYPCQLKTTASLMTQRTDKLASIASST